MYVCMYCMYVQYVCTVCMSVCMYVRMYVCMCIVCITAMNIIIVIFLSMYCYHHGVVVIAYEVYVWMDACVYCIMAGG